VKHRRPKPEQSAHATDDRELRSHTVYAQLRQTISQGELPPGQVLLEAALSERYDASRTPVREALFRLEQEGFVEKVGRQLRVKEFTYPEIEELYQYREGLEKMVVRLCIERCSDAELRELEQEVGSYGSSYPPDHEFFNQHASSFHRKLAELSGNRTIHDSLMAIHDKVMMISYRLLSAPHYFQEAMDEHGLVLKAIKDRDVTIAEAAVRMHIQGVIQTFRRANEAPEGEKRS